MISELGKIFMKMHVFMLHFGLGKRQTENLGRFEVENLEIFFENHSPKNYALKKPDKTGFILFLFGQGS